MTTETAEKKVAYYIYAKGENGENKYVGTAFRHSKGGGLNIVIDKNRYVAFTPRTKTATGESA